MTKLFDFLWAMAEVAYCITAWSIAVLLRKEQLIEEEID